MSEQTHVPGHPSFICQALSFNLYSDVMIFILTSCVVMRPTLYFRPFPIANSHFMSSFIFNEFIPQIQDNSSKCRKSHQNHAAKKKRGNDRDKDKHNEIDKDKDKTNVLKKTNRTPPPQIQDYGICRKSHTYQGKHH